MNCLVYFRYLETQNFQLDHSGSWAQIQSISFQCLLSAKIKNFKQVVQLGDDSESSRNTTNPKKHSFQFLFVKLIH